MAVGQIAGTWGGAEGSERFLSFFDISHVSRLYPASPFSYHGVATRSRGSHIVFLSPPIHLRTYPVNYPQPPFGGGGGGGGRRVALLVRKSLGRQDATLETLGLESANDDEHGEILTSRSSDPLGNLETMGLLENIPREPRRRRWPIGSPAAPAVFRRVASRRASGTSIS